MPTSKNQQQSNYGQKHTTADLTRPRRPDADITKYLTQLPLSHLNDPEHADTLTTIVAELSTNIAGLAAEAPTANLVELLIILVAKYGDLTEIWKNCVDYSMFLALHRYGSHVLQTLLKATKLVDDEQNSLEAYVSQCSDMLSEHTPELLTHVCGNHILRELLLTADTATTLDQMFNKLTNKRKDKKKKLAQSLYGDFSKFETVYNGPMQQDMKNETIAQHILHSNNLADLVRHPSACPLINIVLELNNSNLASEMMWKLSDVIVDLALDSIGSYFIQTLLLVCDDENHAKLVENHLITLDLSNIFAQRIMCYMCITCRDEATAKLIVDKVCEATGLEKSEVYYRAAQLCVKYESLQSKLGGVLNEFDYPSVSQLSSSESAHLIQLKLLSQVLLFDKNHLEANLVKSFAKLGSETHMYYCSHKLAVLTVLQTLTDNENKVIIRMLQSLDLVKLATDRVGSSMLLYILNHVEVKKSREVCRTLCEDDGNSRRLLGDKYGKVVHDRCKELLAKYNNNKKKRSNDDDKSNNSIKRKKHI